MESLPKFLYEQLLQQYGKETTDKIILGYTQERYTSLRVNTTKTTVSNVKQILSAAHIDFELVPWYPDALILSNKVDITKMDLYKNGFIYLQSLSSMLPVLILNPKKNNSILDMAAAPGSKTTQLACLTENQARITACEKHPIRAQRLKYNLEKQGATRVTVLVEDARKLDEFFSFDSILLDAPCSGSGTLSSINLNTFTQELVHHSIETQKQLILKAIQLLKENGECVYSTCSILKSENEDIIKEILTYPNIELEPIDITKFSTLPLLKTTIPGTICICPTTYYEGFFVAKLKKVERNQV